ncbi:MAG TPA: choice-of-anchor D domain-containing protein [Gemmatimonadaceae bacterium]
MPEAPVANKPSTRKWTNGRSTLVVLLLSALSLGAASHAHAAGRFCISADTLLFGNRTVGTNTNMSATVTNCGDASWSFTEVSVDAATGAGFHPSTTCSTGLSLAPGGKCTIDVLFSPFAAGQTSGALWLKNTTSTPTQLITFYGRGVDPQAGSATLSFAPASADFGEQVVGTESSGLVMTLKNLGPDALTPSAIILNGPAVYDFSGSEETCGVGITIPAGKSCQLSLYFKPQQTGQRLANLVVDAPQIASLAILPVSGTGIPAPEAAPYEGLWWNSPGGSEAGWGLNLAQQGDTIFASWFTYDLSGKPWWLAMSAIRTAPNSYTGALFAATGPAFDSVPFPPIGSPGGATGATVGTGTLTFSDADTGSFVYTVNGISQTKLITRESFGALPACTFGAQPDLALATNYQDLWWNAPAGSEAGWGINLVHQGNTIVATWFTYNRDGSPMWLVVAANKVGATTYSGDLFRVASGPPFNAVPFPPIGSQGGAQGSVVGTATFNFSDGNTGTFNYAVDGVTQTKPITREVFASPGTVCQ